MLIEFFIGLFIQETIHLFDKETAIRIEEKHGFKFQRTVQKIRKEYLGVLFFFDKSETIDYIGDNFNRHSNVSIIMSPKRDNQSNQRFTTKGLNRNRNQSHVW